MSESLLHLTVNYYREEDDFAECMEQLYLHFRRKFCPEALGDYLLQEPQILYDLVTQVTPAEFVMLTQSILHTIQLKDYVKAPKHRVNDIKAVYKIEWLDHKVLPVSIVNKQVPHVVYDETSCVCLSEFYTQALSDLVILNSLDKLHTQAFYFDTVKYNKLIQVLKDFINKQEDRDTYLPLLGYIVHSCDLSPQLTKTEGGFNAGTTG